MGERDVTSIWRVKNGEFDNLRKIDAVNSIGLLYEFVNASLGFGDLGGAGKTMGLAQ